MSVSAQISHYLAAQPERKRTDMQTLHDLMLTLMPGCRLWFLDAVKFRSLRDIDLPMLEAAIRDGIAQTSA